MFVSTNALIAWGVEFDRWSLVAQSSSGYIAIVAMIAGLVVGAGALLIVNQLRGRELKAKADAFLSQANTTADNCDGKANTWSGDDRTACWRP